MNEDDLFNKYNSWLSVIHNDIQWLSSNYFIYREIKKIISNNKNIQENNAIYHWMSMVVNDSIAMGIRRQICKRKDSISLFRLLHAFKRKPQIISSERYVALYTTLPQSFAHHDFDNLAGKERKYIDAERIEADIMYLKEKTGNVEIFANKRVAHYGDESYENIPTNDEIQEALDCLEALLKKYLLIFRAESWDIIPIFQFDWLRPLREPWIVS